MAIGGIYIILNKINRKFYLGSSNNLKKRFKEHLRELRRKVHKNKKLQHAFDKHGPDNFEFITLLETNDKELYKIEQEYLNVYKPFELDGYNLRKTTNQTLQVYTPRPITWWAGKHHSDETRQKISNSLIGLMSGSKHPRVKPILQYKNNILIKEWDCGISQVSKQINISRTAINNCLTGRSKSAGSYIWKYKK